MPAPGQVVIDVEAAGVNFVDALIVEGRYQVTPPLPYTPGIRGRRRRSAPSATASTGSPSASASLALPSSGGYASQVVVPAPAAVPIPDNLTAGQAAGLVQSYATMLYALHPAHRPSPSGEWFAVLGAGGGIGLAAVDLATALGAQVVACASTRRQARRWRGPSARRPRSPTRTTASTSRRRSARSTGGGADAVVDPIGGAEGRVGAAQPALGGSLPRRSGSPPARSRGSR